MSTWDLMAAALVEVVDECLQTDETSPKAMWFECNDSKFEDSLNDMLLNMDVETLLPSQVWHVAGFGNSFEKLDYAMGEGVLGMNFVHPMDMRRYWLQRNRKCVGFRWREHKADRNRAFSYADGEPIDRVGIEVDQVKEDLWYPWDFCTTSDTKISLLDGRELSIKQLQEEYGDGVFWVYSATPEGRIVPGRAHSLRLTRHDTEIVEIELDNGEKVKFTPDHPFLLRDGTYRNAGDLKPGDSLMPLYRKFSTFEEHGRDGYELFFDNKCGKWLFTHWRVAEDMHGTKRDSKGKFTRSHHVHHVNFERTNNRPDNLQWLTVAEHNKLHKDINDDPAHKEKQRKGASEGLKRTWKLKREEMRAHASNNRLVEVQKRFEATGSKVTPAQRAASIRNGRFAGLLNKGRKAKERANAATFCNHKVVAVRPAGKSDVYDFTVDGQHNFALSAGVFVHNCHFRRLYRLRMTEHGEPIFDEAQGIYKKLRMALDQMCVFRAQIQPDRYVVNIDTKQLPPKEQLTTVQRWKQSLRSKLSFGTGGLNSPDEFKSFYNAWGLDTILWMAKPEGYLHTIEKLAGTAQVPDVYDIELLQNLFFSIIGMPKWWVMGQKDGAAAPSGKALLASDIRFLRKIKALRRPLIESYTWLGYFHALLKKEKLETLDIKAKMPPIGSLEDQAKVDILRSQAEVLASLGGVMEAFQLPREAWIEIIFKKYMHLPDDVVDVFMTALPPAVGQQGGGGGGMGESKSMPTAKLLAEIHRKVGNSPGLLAAKRRIAEALDGKVSETNTTRYKTPESVLGFAVQQSGKMAAPLQEGDVIQSSFGNDSTLTINPAAATAQPLNESEPAYRRYMR